MSNTLHHSVPSTLVNTILKLICFNNQANFSFYNLLHVSPKVKLNIIHLKLSMESWPSLGLI